MRNLKKFIGHLPIIGYILRWILALLLLPRHIVSLRHAVQRNEDDIKILQDGLLRANRHIIELEEKLDTTIKSRKQS